MTAYDDRVRELSRMPKRKLADLFRVRCTQFLWSAVAPERWTKDELISEVLRIEFPGGAA